MMQKKRKIKVPTNCLFCNEKFEPSFKDVANISKFVNDRGRIVGRDRSGVCAKHQRALAREIKRSRYMGMLPFVAGL